MAGEQVLTASLSTVSYYRLVREDADELAALQQALMTDGFAYLDLRKHDSSRGSVLHGINRVFTMGANFFSTSLDKKMKYDIDAIGPYKLHGCVDWTLETVQHSNPARRSGTSQPRETEELQKTRKTA